jgi:hypothetical protein
MDENQVKKIINEVLTQNTFQPSNVPYHTHSRVGSPPINFKNLTGKTRYLLYRSISPAISVTTGILSDTVVMPFSGSITSIGATVDIAGTTGDLMIQVLKNGTSIFNANSPTIVIASGYTTSRPTTNLNAVISGNNQILPIPTNTFNVGDIFTFDITAIQSTPASGLTIFMNLIETP